MSGFGSTFFWGVRVQPFFFGQSLQTENLQQPHLHGIMNPQTPDQQSGVPFQVLLGGCQVPRGPAVVHRGHLADIP